MGAFRQRGGGSGTGTGGGTGGAIRTYLPRVGNTSQGLAVENQASGADASWRFRRKQRVVTGTKARTTLAGTGAGSSLQIRSPDSLYDDLNYASANGIHLSLHRLQHHVPRTDPELTLDGATSGASLTIGGPTGMFPDGENPARRFAIRRVQHEVTGHAGTAAGVDLAGSISGSSIRIQTPNVLYTSDGAFSDGNNIRIDIERGQHAVSATTESDATVDLTNVPVRVTLGDGADYNGWTLSERYGSSRFRRVDTASREVIVRFNSSETIAENLAAFNADSTFTSANISFALTSGDGSANPPPASTSDVTHNINNGTDAQSGQTQDPLLWTTNTNDPYEYRLRVASDHTLTEIQTYLLSLSTSMLRGQAGSQIEVAFTNEDIVITGDGDSTLDSSLYPPQINPAIAYEQAFSGGRDRVDSETQGSIAFESVTTGANPFVRLSVASDHTLAEIKTAIVGQTINGYTVLDADVTVTGADTSVLAASEIPTSVGGSLVFHDWEGGVNEVPQAALTWTALTADGRRYELGAASDHTMTQIRTFLIGQTMSRPGPVSGGPLHEGTLTSADVVLTGNGAFTLSLASAFNGVSVGGSASHTFAGGINREPVQFQTISGSKVIQLLYDANDTFSSIVSVASGDVSAVLLGGTPGSALPDGPPGTGTTDQPFGTFALPGTTTTTSTTQMGGTAAYSDAIPLGPSVSGSAGSGDVGTREGHRHPLPTGSQVQNLLDTHLGGTDWRTGGGGTGTGGNRVWFTGDTNYLGASGDNNGVPPSVLWDDDGSGSPGIDELSVGDTIFHTATGRVFTIDTVGTSDFDVTYVTKLDFETSFQVKAVSDQNGIATATGSNYILVVTADFNLITVAVRLPDGTVLSSVKTGDILVRGANGLWRRLYTAPSGGGDGGSNVPDKPATPSSDTEYNLQIESDGTASWVEDTGGGGGATGSRFWIIRNESNWDLIGDVGDSHDDVGVAPSEVVGLSAVGDLAVGDRVFNEVDARLWEIEAVDATARTVDIIERTALGTNIPDKPSGGSATSYYRLRVGTSGGASWVDAPVGSDVPDKPATPSSDTEYNLQIESDGTASWVEDTGGDGGGTSYTDADATDAAGALVATLDEFTYDESTNDLDFTPGFTGVYFSTQNSTSVGSTSFLTSTMIPTPSSLDNLVGKHVLMLNRRIYRITGAGTGANGPFVNCTYVNQLQSGHVGTNLGFNRTATAVTVTSSTGNNVQLPAAGSAGAGVMTTAQESKLAGVEDNSTADQTADEIIDLIEAQTGDDRLDATRLRNLPTGGGTSQPTNISFSRDSDSVTIESSTGTNADVPAADSSNAGVMSAAQATKLAGLDGVDRTIWFITSSSVLASTSDTDSVNPSLLHDDDGSSGAEIGDLTVGDIVINTGTGHVFSIDTVHATVFDATYVARLAFGDTNLTTSQIVSAIDTHLTNNRWQRDRTIWFTTSTTALNSAASADNVALSHLIDNDGAGNPSIGELTVGDTIINSTSGHVFLIDVVNAGNFDATYLTQLQFGSGGGTSYTDDDAKDAAGELLATLDEFTYNDSTNQLTFTAPTDSGVSGIVDGRDETLTGAGVTDDNKIVIERDGIAIVHTHNLFNAEPTATSWEDYTGSNYNGVRADDFTVTSAGPWYFNIRSMRMRTVRAFLVGTELNYFFRDMTSSDTNYPSNYIGHYKSREEALSFAADKGITAGQSFVAFTGQKLEQAHGFALGTDQAKFRERQFIPVVNKVRHSYCEFWGQGQTAGTQGSGVTKSLIGSSEYYRTIYRQAAPDLQLGGDVGIRMLTASQASDADLVTGETLPNYAVVRVPPGLHLTEFHVSTLSARRRELNGWLYKVQSGTDDFKLHQGSSFTTPNPEPINPSSAVENWGETITIVRTLYLTEETDLTLFLGTFHSAAEAESAFYWAFHTLETY